MRRTKQESEQTRQDVLAAARRVFARRGVTRTTIGQIAVEAGVTRGAVYWHFADKTKIFHAMREQVSVPLLDRTDFELLSGADGDALEAVERFLRDLFDTIANDRETRRTFQIMLLKCEYVDEFAPELPRQIANWRTLEAKLTNAYERARRMRAMRGDLSPTLAALETCVFVSGLIRLSLLDEKRVFIRGRAHELIVAHIASRRGIVARRTPARSRAAA
ncbi:MAG: TetR family transcriptional regulator [Aromatoleum sp.]|nr:TetR family transcriptional regulator [Aromatoleum sp.]